ncbi:single-stranded-DNA-specific exonuclease RecJ [Candidatus Microgenomates bacterium]|nr:MAG: single-stranded-DNA-specific exonuclease RecJ [Candidatus Microgenomates bacterium]
MKRWEVKNKLKIKNLPAGKAGEKLKIEELVSILLKNRNISSASEQKNYLNPKHPSTLTTEDVGIDQNSLNQAIDRIIKAIKNQEQIVVYADYDADGVTAAAIMWETIHLLGGKVAPYIPHRVDEGYGFSRIGIDNVIAKHKPALIISVDHGITAHEKIAYAQGLGVEVIVTDHHTKPEQLPDCLIVHTTKLCGAGVAWFVAMTLLSAFPTKKIDPQFADELLTLAAIGTIADMMPLVDTGRALSFFGLKTLSKTNRIGLLALITSSGINQEKLTTYDVSHRLAPRLNAMGRLTHALDALRLLCTTNADRAQELAQVLHKTNSERQEMTQQHMLHAQTLLEQQWGSNFPKFLLAADPTYNPGVIGLVAGKLVEQYYRPTVVVSRGDTFSKASARSIAGFNIIDAIRSLDDLLIDCGGHPMAAGFTIATEKLDTFTKQLTEIAEQQISDAQLMRTLTIDMEIPLSVVTTSVWEAIRKLEPFGMGNSEPVFATSNVQVVDARSIGRENKHLKLTVTDGEHYFDAIGFSLGNLIAQISPDTPISLAYNIDINEWNGKRNLQLKIRDIQFAKS